MGHKMIEKLKWISVAITIIAAVTISFKLTAIWLSYCLFLIGHSIMIYVMIRNKDWSLLTMNLIWIVIDITGFINWF